MKEELDEDNLDVLQNIEFGIIQVYRADRLSRGSVSVRNGYFRVSRRFASGTSEGLRSPVTGRFPNPLRQSPR
jgi:hypothetical protein